MKPLRLKNMIAGCLLAAGALPVWGQSGAPTLVIRIDDLGALHSVNEACIQTYRSGIARSVEVMPVAAWYPEAIKMLKENPGLDVGLHLVITSEWENVKWRPLTHCPSLTDENGYFYPMMFPNPAYPGQSIMEQKWDIKEIEQEFRAQIETTLKSIPQLSHLSGHMLSTGFSKEVNELVQRLAKEYNLPSIDRMDSSKDYRFTYIGYDGPKRTAEEKEASFIKALEKLQPGQRYLFLDHPALDNDEMKTVFHIGYEDVALDRQGVTDLLTSPRVRKAIEDKGIKLISINQLTKGLPRAAATPKLDKAMNRYLDAVKKAGQDLHSIMIVQHGNVIAEEWMGEGKEDEPHILNSVSKTFTATAVGLAASEGRLKLTDKVISFFPDKLPATVSENLAAMTVRDLLTMNCGHDTDPTGTVRKKADADWVQEFLAFPVEHKPGTFYTYNSLGTYMLSAIVQKVTGEKVVDYLYPRLFRPAWHRQRPVAGKPARHQYRRLGVVPQNGRPCQDGTTVPAERKLERTADSARRMGKGGICLPSALTARRHETGDAEESEDERQDKRLAAGLRLPDVALPPQRLPCRWCQRTIHTGVAGQGCRHCRHRQHPRHAGRAESNMEVPAARAIKRLFL